MRLCVLLLLTTACSQSWRDQWGDEQDDQFNDDGVFIGNTAVDLALVDCTDELWAFEVDTRGLTSTVRYAAQRFYPPRLESYDLVEVEQAEDRSTSRWVLDVPILDVPPRTDEEDEPEPFGSELPCSFERMTWKVQLFDSVGGEQDCAIFGYDHEVFDNERAQQPVDSERCRVFLGG